VSPHGRGMQLAARLNFIYNSTPYNGSVGKEIYMYVCKRAVKNAQVEIMTVLYSFIQL